MKYPLTESTQEAARYIVDMWRSGNLSQRLTVTINYDSDTETAGMVYGATSAEFVPPKLEVWQELAQFRLVSLSINDNWEVLLLQELRNAVENDFEVSEYFLTMNAVGTIVQGDLSVHPTANFQSAASISGDVKQKIAQELPDSLVQILGEEFLQTQKDLRDAINALRNATESDRQSKLGKVVSELGRCLEHGANFAVVTSALLQITPLLQSMLGG